MADIAGKTSFRNGFKDRPIVDFLCVVEFVPARMARRVVMSPHDEACPVD